MRLGPDDAAVAVDGASDVDIAATVAADVGGGLTAHQAEEAAADSPNCCPRS